MAQTVEFFFDYSCPYAYLASTQIEALCERAGAELVWRPMLLGGVFRELGTAQNLAGSLHPSKARHNALDMIRWAATWNVPLSMPPKHPMRTVTALRATLSVAPEHRARVIHRLYRAYWVENLEIHEPEVVSAALSEIGLDGPSLVGPFDPSVKEALRANTDEALERGVFGAPTTFVGSDGYWGQDRLWMVEKRLGVQSAAITESSIGPLEPTGDAGPVVDFYFDFSSPWTYLAATQIESVCERHGAELRLRPMLLGGLFKSLGGPSVPLSTFPPSKQKYVSRDLMRWAEHWNIPFSWPSRFPMRTVLPLRVACALGTQSRAYIRACFHAFWVDDADISDPSVVAAILSQVGADPAVVEQASDPLIKKALIDGTTEAQEAGAFGAPTFVVNGHLFWGQDRFALLERVLRGWEPPTEYDSPAQ